MTSDEPITRQAGVDARLAISSIFHGSEYTFDETKNELQRLRQKIDDYLRAMGGANDEHDQR